jgi:hypothetical protein
MIDRLGNYRSKLGKRFEPAPLLSEMAKSGKKFYG